MMNILKVITYACVFALIWVNAIIVDATKDLELGYINSITDVNACIILTFVASLIVVWQAFEATSE